MDERFLSGKAKLLRQQNWPPSFVYTGAYSLDSLVTWCTARTLLVQFLAIAIEQNLNSNSKQLDYGKYLVMLKRFDAVAQRILNKFNTKYAIESAGTATDFQGKFHFFFDPIGPDAMVRFDETVDIKEMWWLKKGNSFIFQVRIRIYHMVTTFTTFAHPKSSADIEIYCIWRMGFTKIIRQNKGHNTKFKKMLNKLYKCLNYENSINNNM